MFDQLPVPREPGRELPATIRGLRPRQSPNSMASRWRWLALTAARLRFRGRWRAKVGGHPYGRFCRRRPGIFGTASGGPLQAEGRRTAAHVPTNLAALR